MKRLIFIILLLPGVVLAQPSTTPPSHSGGSSGGTTYVFDSTQFGITTVTNITIKDGALFTNITVLNLTMSSPFTLGGTIVTTTGTEFNYVGGVTSLIQNQLNDKQQTNATLTRLQNIGVGVSGDVIYRDANGWTNLAKAADGTVLKLTAGLPAWGVDNNSVGGESAGTVHSGGDLTVDNTLVRSDGTGGTNVQKSVVLLSDVGAITAVESLTATNNITAANFVAGATNMVGELSAKAPLASPVLTGDPTVPNVVLSDSDLTIANTAFVKSNITAIVGQSGVVHSTDLTVDNTLMRSDGTSGTNAQKSVVLLSDVGALTAVESIVVTNSVKASTYELGGVTDTTLARSGAGDVSVEGNVIYRAGGTDVAVADGGTGLSSGNSGGILAYTASGTLASSAALTVGGLVVGGGAGVVPSTVTVGATTEILVGGGVGNSPIFTTATGSGAPVRATTPTLTTPVLGVATATSVNKVAITAPASSATLTLADGKTFTVNQTTTLDRQSSTGLPVEFCVAASDETTAITTGTSKVTFRAPYAFTLTKLKASVNTAPTGSTILIDVNESGTTVISTKLMIDASEKTSETAATPYVISDSAIADDAELSIDFDQVGSTISGTGVKVWIYGYR